MDSIVDKKQFNITGLLSRLGLKWRYFNFSDEADKDIHIDDISPEMAHLLSNYPRRFKPTFELCSYDGWDIEDDIPPHLISQLSKLHFASNTDVDLQIIVYHIKLKRFRVATARNSLPYLVIFSLVFRFYDKRQFTVQC
ncbi:hypothetical protein HOLleu_01224 [Holothuria leucospilota]|uniref:Uncharacterized protein n=1 Tax=Holothuria leucospilota TaxID=206669 RepID=A0A9Q1CQJ3_HOLLE|nr:hypothetical protein HOLleu_01224 [Holothuria leucospilota]